MRWWAGAGRCWWKKTQDPSAATADMAEDTPALFIPAVLGHALAWGVALEELGISCSDTNEALTERYSPTRPAE